MRAIYEPKGPAREYSPLALNHYLFCGHGCDYCYARLMMRKSKEQWVNGYTEKKNVLLCFMSDPYQPCEAEQCLTRKVLQTMQKHGVKPTVLTKGGMLTQRDFDILSSIEGSDFAVTLTTDDDTESLEWEPGAALPQERIANLQAAHAAGIRTWVSLEPVFNPGAVLRLIRQVSPFSDMIKIGKLNHDRRAAATDWATFRTDVVDLLESLDCDYLIKHDLEVA